MDRSDWGDDETEGFRPPLPPEDRVWRHPSELGTGFVAAPPAPSRRQSRGPLVIAAVTAGLLLIGATGASLRFMGDGVTNAANGIGGTLVSLARTSATVDRLGARTAGLRVVATLSNGSERTSRAVVIDPTTVVTTIAAVAGSRSLAVVLPDGRRFDAGLLGRDRNAGIVVLDVGGATLTPDPMGSVVTMRVGDEVWVAGRAEPGTISALGRHTNSPDGVKIHHVLRLDIDDTRPDEGQALLDAKGVVVGLCAWDAKGDVVGIPADLAVSAAHSLRSYDRLALPWIGVSGRDADVDDEEGRPNGGAVLTGVDKGGPAEQAGFRAGDVVIALGDVAVSSISSLVLAARAHDIGEAVPVSLTRNGAPETLTLTLGELPAD